MTDYTAARSLSLPIADDDALASSPRRSAFSPSWQRRSLSESHQPRSATSRWFRSASRLQNRALRAFQQLSPLQQAGLILLNIGLLLGVILFSIYNERIFASLSPVAHKWRALPGGWLILWFMTFFVSFPPMIGYSTCVTIAGFVYGMKGWFIIASATIAGSTASFLASRTLLKSFVSRMTEKNKQFAALSLVLKHDGLKLLMMIRLCPLPYSLSNGAISTIPTVTWQNFALATAMVSPKLLLHIFVGRQIGQLAQEGNKMDAKTKAVSYVSIVIGMVAGMATGYYIYSRVKARAQELESDQPGNTTGSGSGRRSSDRADYIDDLEREPRSGVLRSSDDVSLHTAYADDDDDRDYRDEFTDDEDARERDVFDAGDGGTGTGSGDEEEGGRKGRR